MQKQPNTITVELFTTLRYTIPSMSKIKIAVNARMLLKDRLDGVGWLAYQTLKRITQAHPEVEFIFLFDRKFNSEFIFSDNITPVVIWPPTRHPFLWYIWFQISVKSLLNKLKPDLFLSHDGFISLGAHCKQLSLIPDINFYHYPKDLPFAYRIFFNRYFPKYARAADKIVTISHFCKNDIAITYHMQPSEIDVVHIGADTNYTPLDEQSKQKIRRQYTGDKEYFIFVGSVHPRKNIIRLLQAFDLFKQSSESAMKLVIAGSFFWGKTKLDETLQKMKFKDDVIFTGRVPDAQLPKLMAAAFCLAFVSYFEGFGIPLVEAMRSGVPIITSNITSMPEVAGPAALYVNPFKMEEIADAMIRISNDSSLRKQLILNGEVQSKKFSWDAASQELWSIIKSMLPATTKN